MATRKRSLSGPETLFLISFGAGLAWLAVWMIFALCTNLDGEEFKSLQRGDVESALWFAVSLSPLPVGLYLVTEPLLLWFFPQSGAPESEWTSLKRSVQSIVGLVLIAVSLPFLAAACFQVRRMTDVNLEAEVLAGLASLLFPACPLLLGVILLQASRNVPA
jgi:hypothetical protein